MTRICITGGPRTGKTTLANQLGDERGDHIGSLVAHTDDLIALGWSEASAAASKWLDVPGPWIVEGVAVSRALRKWREPNQDQPPPVDLVIRLHVPHEMLSRGPLTMAKGEQTVWDEISRWIDGYGVPVEYRSTVTIAWNSAETA